MGEPARRTSTTPSPPALRDRDVEVLYLTDLLTETLEAPEARERAIAGAMENLHLGDTLRAYLDRPCTTRGPRSCAPFLTAGVRNDEVRGGHGLVTSLLAHDDFLIDPLPNLLFTRDSSVWIRDRVAITSLAMPARERETQLTELIYSDHPRFAGTPTIHGWQREHVEGGDVLLLAPGVIAVGVGERTTPAGAERLARQVFGADLAHTVLAVPIAQERATMHLDTVCTMVDVDKIVMYPNVADSLQAYAVTLPERGDTDADLSPAGRRGGAVPGGRGQGDEHRHAAPDRHRAGPGHRRARAVGRRQQHPGHLAAGGGGLRAQHRDELAAGGVRHRGGGDLGLRAGLRAGRSALHVLPGLAGPAAGVGDRRLGMVEWVWLPVAVVSLLVVLVAVGYVVVDRAIDLWLLTLMVLLFALTLLQLVAGVVELVRTDRDVSGVLFVSYLVGTVLVAPLTTLWALGERSRAGTAVLIVAGVLVPVLLLRLDAIWTSPGA